MYKLLAYSIIGSVLLFNTQTYNGSTTAAVTLAAGIIKTNQLDPSTKKYKRKDCPVCKGKGWYISGDGIEKVECGYCEPEQGISAESTTGPNCTTKVYRR